MIIVSKYVQMATIAEHLMKVSTRVSLSRTSLAMTINGEYHQWTGKGYYVDGIKKYKFDSLRVVILEDGILVDMIGEDEDMSVGFDFAME